MIAAMVTICGLVIAAVVLEHAINAWKEVRLAQSPWSNRDGEKP